MTPSSLPLRGYAALISALIICTTLTVLAFQASTSAYLARLSALEAEHAAMVHADAYSCMQIALFELSADWSYRPEEGGNKIVLSPEAQCEIGSVVASSTRRIVTVHGSRKGLKSTLEIKLEERPISSPPFVVLSIREI